MGNPIKILHVVVNMNRGGAETLIMNLFRHIQRDKVMFDFLTCLPGAYDEEIQALGGRIHRIPYLSQVGHFGYLKELQHFFNVYGDSYPVVHSHMDKMSGLVLRAAQKAGVPVRIAHSHNTRSEGGMAARLYKWYVGRHVAASATSYIACSNAAARWLFADRAKQSGLLHNGIAFEQFAYSESVRMAVREELNIPSDVFVIGHVGRFALQKNHAGLLALFTKLQWRMPQKNMLVLAGDGPLRQQIERQAESLGIADKVKFLGVRSDVERLLQAFDVFVFPSFHEGLPVTLIEAQASGLPCVVSDRITEEADIGLSLMKFFPLPDQAAAIELIRQALLEPPSRQLDGRQLAEKGYDIKQTAQWTEHYYIDQLR